jgi:ABC-2 type transport system permease protein
MINNSKIRILVALCKKDFLVSHSSIPMVAVTLLTLGGAFFSQSVIWAFILIINSLGYDEMGKIDTLLCSLPVKRSDIVFAKYLYAWCITLAMLIIPDLLSLLWRILFSGSDKLSLPIGNMYYPLIFLFGVCAIIFPVYFKFPIRVDETILSYVIVVVIGGVIFYYEQAFMKFLINLPEVMDFQLFPVCCMFGTIGLSVLSISISSDAFKRHECQIGEIKRVR